MTKNLNKKIIIDKKIISTLGIDNIQPAKQKKIIKKLEENIQRKIVLSVMQNLNEEERRVFNSIIKLKDNKMTYAFINSTIPDIAEFIRDVAVNTIKEFKKLSV